MVGAHMQYSLVNVVIQRERLFFIIYLHLQYLAGESSLQINII